MLVVQALALCSFLDNNRHLVDLQGKEVLELGAGTGLVSIVASLLGVYSDTRKNVCVYVVLPLTLSCSRGSVFVSLSRMAKASA